MNLFLQLGKDAVNHKNCGFLFHVNSGKQGKHLISVSRVCCGIKIIHELRCNEPLFDCLASSVT
jgi:hypothetical protein